MIPRVFVSSTVRDLLHVRDAVRDQLVRLGYQPVMSEHGEIGYLPDRTAADSCYIEAQTCQLGVVIIGKRYGDDHKDGASVTHNECRTLFSNKIPVVTLVEKDIFTFKSVFDANDGKVNQFPGMDHPSKTFSFIGEVMRSSVNNGVAEFQHASDAQDYIRTQFAHLFASMLTERNDPVKAEVKDILAAVTALRGELLQKQDDPKVDSNRILHISRALLDESVSFYRKLLERLLGSLDDATRAIIQYPSFKVLVEAQNKKLIINDEKFDAYYTSPIEEATRVTASTVWIADRRNQEGAVEVVGWFMTADELCMTESTFVMFEDQHEALRSRKLSVSEVSRVRS
jgi:hypothetical protein